jgi:L-seryl-tRNA(Ser) seleniumtransferase
MDEARRITAPAGAADIPSLDRLITDQALGSLLARYGRAQLTGVLRTHLASLRREALAGKLTQGELTLASLVAALERQFQERARSRLRPVFNLTGTVLHTNLGRALLPDAAIQGLLQSAATPVSLEYDLASGRRGDRDSLIEDLLCELTGAQAATVVNNNAAAVLLMLSALAGRREVLVSRGELVEIGGTFRIPDIMRQAGARLVEVGTTNRTRLADYEQGLTARSALLMKVNTSNYVIRGFTQSVSLAELAPLARTRGIPLVADLGSGSIVDLAIWGLPREPTAQQVLAAADLVCFSGDKLLGGPQSGLILGRADLISKLKKHPLKRALRVGKLTLAALEAVLMLYRAPEQLAERLPTLTLLTRPPAAMLEQAARLRDCLQRALGEAYQVSDAPVRSQIGSGALPLDELPSHALTIRLTPHGDGRRARVTLPGLERRLRACARPIIGRVSDDALWLDLRCLEPADESEFLAQWRGLGR